MNYTIDATGKKIGRIATDAAKILMNKNVPTFEKNKLPTNTVTIVNASKVSVTDKKLSTKIYPRYSGHPGGFKTPTMQQVVAKKGFAEIFRDAIVGMLPKNKLQKQMMKHLTITE